MNFEHFPAIMAAIAIALLFFAMAFTILANSTIESVKERITNLEISCSDVSKMNSAKITYKDLVIYCAIEEKKQT